jgi:hypothetical protein
LRFAKKIKPCFHLLPSSFVTYLLAPNTNSYGRRKTLAAERKSLDERLRVGDEGVQNIYTAGKRNFREVRGAFDPS